MDVRAITFTGSPRTGRLIQEASAKSNLKNVILELGGKSPSVILDDCDLDAAVEGTRNSMTWNSGQVCMANSRVYVQESIADKYIALFKEKFAAAKMGDPLESNITLGPLADELQYNNVQKYIEEGKKSGKLILGGEKAEEGKGWFVKPTIFTETPEDAKIMKEEIFGPVVNINVFKTDDEVLEKANNSEYGLYASVWTKNIDRALKFVRALEAGTVGVNCTSPTVAPDMPFGGYKGSGVGREGIHESIDHFLEVKTVLIKLDI